MLERGFTASMATMAARGLEMTAVQLDFDDKVITPVDLSGACAVIAAGGYVWIDLDYDDPAPARSALEAIGLASADVLDDIFAGLDGPQLSRFESYVHLVLTGCRLDPDGHLHLERVDTLVAERCLVTVRRGRRDFLDAMKREYGLDFQRHAQSPSFLIYELWDHLTDHYVAVQKQLEARVNRVQANLMDAEDDEVFHQVSTVGSDLLHFRSVLVPARTVLNEMATRRTIFVNERTQPYLANMVGTLDRVLQDLLVDRDILGQSLSLQMSIASHRTNQAMRKLTVLSTIFLPLTFLCGVYGMNFELMPELRWRLGYLFFWGLATATVVVLVVIMRRAKFI